MNDPAKIALVTGGSRGIGRAIVLDLARRGFAVHFTYLENEQAAFSVVDATKGFDGLVVPARVDARDVAACASFVARVIAEGGRVDLLVNNAGILSDRLLAMMTTDDWRSVVDTSLNGLFGMTQLTAKQMMRQRGGRIVNLSSVSGVVGIPGQTAYSAAKAAIIGFTRSLSKELARYGATVNAVAPGFIDTEMLSALSEKQRTEARKSVPMGRFGTCEEIAGLVGYLATDAPPYLTGQVLVVDGGLT
jgi:3-oxoacyl-[acyl-carrier protein] reductase